MTGLQHIRSCPDSNKDCARGKQVFNHDDSHENFAEAKLIGVVEFVHACALLSVVRRPIQRLHHKLPIQLREGRSVSGFLKGHK